MRFQGTAHGSPQKPQLAGSLTGTHLRYGDWNAGDLSLAGNFDVSDRLTSRLELDAHAIGWGSVLLDSLRVHGQGKASAHTIDILATRKASEAMRLSSTITGRYANEEWRARATPLALVGHDEVAPTGEVAQARLMWALSQWSIDDLCLLWTSYKFCANAESHDGWRLSAQSDQLPLNIFDDTFPESSRYQGQWQVRAQFSGSDWQPLTGDATMTVTDASLTYQPIAGAEETVRLGTGRVNFSATTERLLASLNITTPGTSSIDANMRIERNPNIEFARLPLSGEMHVHTAEANLLPLIYPDIDRAAGELTAQISATGTAKTPLLQGQVDLKNGELDLYRFNLNLRDLGITARIVDNRLAFDGHGRIGDGKLSMNGDMQWRDLTPVARLHMQGQDLLVADLPEYRVVASPTLDFNIDGKNVDVRGEVTIPKARLEPRDLRGAVQTSRDARLIGETPAPPMGGFNVRSEVRIRLGDEVRLESFGLQGNLGGSVAVITSSTAATGSGEVNVSGGRYEAYGQKLEITRGRLLFDASPLDNPALDIQAERMIEDQRVGVYVRGTLHAPRVTVFSDPVLPSSQVVSMLLTGKPITDLSSKDAATVGAAQDNLRLQGGSVIASQIGRPLGLEEVSFESNGLNDTSLVLGKFLSPRLFVSYGISLTESINTLKLRYKLSDRWRIQAEAGQNQSADLEYRIER